MPGAAASPISLTDRMPASAHSAFAGEEIAVERIVAGARGHHHHAVARQHGAVIRIRAVGLDTVSADRREPAVEHDTHARRRQPAMDRALLQRVAASSRRRRRPA